jgi:TonB-dependent starch-binding outer membrane protein SusC
MKKTLTKLMFFMVFVLSVSATYAQRMVTGMVKDSKSGEALIGANVLVKGTTTGTITDIDGSYSLKAPVGSTIVVSYTGYDNMEMIVGESGNLDFSMAEGALLDEVVVVGYGSQKKRDVTGSVASLKEKDFNQGVMLSADQLLQNRVAGVNIINNSGQPGGEATVKIRGNNSVRAGANPLYVIDGVPLDGRSAKVSIGAAGLGSIAGSSPINFLSPADIASIDVLKDASAAAIYGSRASNGVILITTKKAKSGATTLDFNTSIGTSSILNKYKIATGDEYRGALTKYGLTGGNGGKSVDALDAILRSGSVRNYNVSLGSGTENATFRFSGGYQDAQGIVQESGLKRINGALNSNFKLMEGKIGVDALLLATQTNEVIAPISSDAGFQGNLMAAALQWNPTVELTNSKGEFTTGKNNPLVGNSTINPLQLLRSYDETAKTTTLLANISPYWNITNKLTYRYRLSLGNSEGTARGFIKGDVPFETTVGKGAAAIGARALNTVLHSNTLNYQDKLTSSINFDGLLGFEYQKSDWSGSGLSGLGYTVQDYDYTVNIGSGADGNERIFSFVDPAAELQSYFGRVNLGFSDRFNLTATIRADGSSKFGTNNKYGIFPSFGASWNLKNESFLAGSSTISDMKLRLGWGVTGNQEFPTGASQVRYFLNSQGGAEEANVANPDLKWESSTTLNAGLDFGLISNKLTGSIDYYNRVTSDLLLDPTLSEPGPSGRRAWKNIDGSVTNSGIEIGLLAQLIEKSNFGWTLGGNVSFLNNKYEGPNVLTGNLFGQGSTGAYVQQHESGYPLNTFFVREYLGLDDKGNSKYTADGDKLLPLGDPNANIILGISTSVDISKLKVGLNFNGAMGHQLYNNTAMSVISIGNLGTRNIDASLLGGTIKENTANAISSSSRYLEKGDFVKLANAFLSYNIGNISKFKNVNVSLSGNNLLLFTDYSGFDPEVNTVNLRNGIPSSGIEYLPYPSARSIVLGLNVSL